MSDQEYADLREKIDKLFDFWIDELRLVAWTTTIEYQRENLMGLTSMRCHPQWKYRLATISVNMPVCAGFSDGELDETVVHELLHMHLSPLDTKGPKADLEEMVVTDLAIALCRGPLRCTAHAS